MFYGLYIFIIIILSFIAFTLTTLAIWSKYDPMRFKDDAFKVFSIFAILIYLTLLVFKLAAPSHLSMYAKSLDLSRAIYFQVIDDCKNPSMSNFSDCKAKITEAILDTTFNHKRFINELNKVNIE